MATTDQAATSGSRRVVLDWDGTCVESVWPKRDGEWILGAVEFMRAALDLGVEVVIQSTRFARYEIDERTPYAEHDKEIHAVAHKLDQVGLKDVRLWLHDWKPGALMYVDDKSFPRFIPSEWGWGRALTELKKRLNDLDEKVVVKVPVPPYQVIPTPPVGVWRPEDDQDSKYPDETGWSPPTPIPNMRQFVTGATRNDDSQALDYEGFLSPLALEAYGQYMHRHRFQADGSVRDSDNWQKGIPVQSFCKSLIRHTLDAWKEHRGYGSRDGLQDALCAIIFNAQGWLHEIKKKHDDNS